MVGSTYAPQAITTPHPPIFLQPRQEMFRLFLVRRRHGVGVKFGPGLLGA